MTLQQDRIAKGQCPTCGKEAAPYRLCYDCRITGKIVRVLRRAEKAGAFESEMRGRVKYWKIGKDADAINRLKWRADPKAGDGRLAPRLHGSRVDVEGTLVEIMKLIGRPCTIEEIQESWGRLRARRNAPLASDLATIIKASDKRARRALKRAEIDARQNGGAAP